MGVTWCSFFRREIFGFIAIAGLFGTDDGLTALIGHGRFLVGDRFNELSSAEPYNSY